MPATFLFGCLEFLKMILWNPIPEKDKYRLLWCSVGQLGQSYKFFFPSENAES